MAQATVRSHIDVSFDIARDIAPEIAFDFISLVEDLPDFDHVVIAEVIGFEIKIDPRVL